MLCLHKPIVVPLVLVCVCQFFSACRTTSPDTETIRQDLSEEPVPSQESEEPDPRKTRTPVWRGTVKGDDPLGSAAEIYFGSPSNPAGVFEYQGLVFCIAEIPLEEGQDDDLIYEMDGMLLEKEMIQEHYHLPSDFKLQRRVLENRIDDDLACFRYATVYRLKDILALRK